MADDYFQLLKHPKWQEKRLRIMERDGFECRECGDKNTTLNVHHGYYTKGAKPWEYPDESLRCLCEKCHKERHDSIDRVKKAIATLSIWSLDIVTGFAKGVLLQESAPSETKVQVFGDAEPCGFALAYSLPFDGYLGPMGVVQDCDEEGMVTHQVLVDLGLELQEQLQAEKV